MKMAKPQSPGIVRLFENLLWVHSPKHWIVKSLYIQQTLFITILIETNHEGEYRKIRRSFHIDVLDSRSEDLLGLAADCVDEMMGDAV